MVASDSPCFYWSPHEATWLERVERGPILEQELGIQYCQFTKVDRHYPLQYSIMIIMPSQYCRHSTPGDTWRHTRSLQVKTTGRFREMADAEQKMDAWSGVASRPRAEVRDTDPGATDKPGLTGPAVGFWKELVAPQRLPQGCMVISCGLPWQHRFKASWRWKPCF